MAYAEKNKTEEVETRFVPFTQELTHIELAKLDKEIHEHFMENGKFQEQKMLFAKGAINGRGDVIISGFQYIPHPKPRERGEMIADCYPIKYQEWTSKIEQWKRWVDRTNYIHGNKQEYIAKAIENASKKININL